MKLEYAGRINCAFRFICIKSPERAARTIGRMVISLFVLGREVTNSSPVDMLLTLPAMRFSHSCDRRSDLSKLGLIESNIFNERICNIISHYHAAHCESDG